MSKERFIVIEQDDERVPEYERNGWYDYVSFLWDSETQTIIASDRGEPEDQTFGRDWAWVPVELNKLASRLAEVKKERDDLLQSNDVREDVWNAKQYLKKELEAAKERIKELEEGIVKECGYTPGTTIEPLKLLHNHLHSVTNDFNIHKFYHDDREFED